MGGNRSLDEFLGESNDSGGSDAAEAADPDADGRSSESDGADAEGSEAADDGDETTPGRDAGDDPVSDDDAAFEREAAPATPTYRFAADGECAACGSRTERLWHDGGEYVCADCKEW